MKRNSRKLLLALTLAASTALTANAWFNVGQVVCDANGNHQIDASDAGVPSVLVVITNVSGTFSNANWTQPNGLFVIDIPPGPDSYVDYLHPLTLPLGTTNVLPGTHAFTASATVEAYTNNFLVQTPICNTNIPITNLCYKVGFVWCDANSNGDIDCGDKPVRDVLIIVTNASGTYSNAVWTREDGYFEMQLPCTADTYVDYPWVNSLPAGSTDLKPYWNWFTFQPGQQIVTNHFLVANPACATNNACWARGHGVIRYGKGQPAFSFEGKVWPGCGSPEGDGGTWNVIAHNLKLQFKGTVVDILNCGKVEGKPYNFIEFQGYGTLKGQGQDEDENCEDNDNGNGQHKNNGKGNNGKGKAKGNDNNKSKGNSSGKGNDNKAKSNAYGKSNNKPDYGLVYFNARVEDVCERGNWADRLYLRVHTAQGQTLLLISAQPGHQSVVAPACISSGNLEIHSSACDDPPGTW